MRIDRKADRREVGELTVRAMLTGNFGAAFTRADNSTSVATDEPHGQVECTVGR
jgi:urate oxidase